MAFPAFQAQLLAQVGQSPSTLKADDLPDAMRYLAPNGPLFQGIPGFPGVPGALGQGLPGLPLGPYPGMPLEFKPEMLSAGGGPMAPIFFDAMGGYHPYGVGERRKNATRETTAPLKQWLSEHRKNPYPSKNEKLLLAVMTKMTLTQVSTWFANARRRLKKENKMTWSPRNRPGEDDDDDLADMDTVDVNERPSSSTSDFSGLAGPLLNGDRGSESNNNAGNLLAGGPPKSSPSPSHNESETTPKKSGKIWSIADISSAPQKGSDDGDSKEENGSGDEAGSSKKDTDESPLNGMPQTPLLPPMLMAIQPYLAMMRQAMPGGGLFPPGSMGGPKPPAGPFPPQLAMFNAMPMMLLQQQLAAAAAAAAAASASTTSSPPQTSPLQMSVSQLNGSWSEGHSPSPSSSNHSAAAVSDDMKAPLAETA